MARYFTTKNISLDILRRHIERIVTLTDEEFSLISSHFTAQQFQKKQFVFRPQERVPFVYFILSGLTVLVHLDDNGQEHILSFAMEDWWETDLGAFLHQRHATMGLYCLEDTAMLKLSLDGYNTICSRVPKMERFFLAKANGGHIASQQRILSFQMVDAKLRYQWFLERYPFLVQRISKTVLASYLGVSRETLSRLSRSR
nr:Crp/Fnr family transcriptional regulator [Terrimonas ginsenosidimutans]